MENVLLRMLHNLEGRLDGPLHFRFFMQPAMSIFFAIRDGIRDSREQSPPYFWALCTDPARRPELLRHGWKTVGRVFLLAMALDLIYQILEFHWFYPEEALLTSFLLALLPYALVRGPVNRIARRWRAGRETSHAADTR
jgi:hypothetical protein